MPDITFTLTDAQITKLTSQMIQEDSAEAVRAWLLRIMNDTIKAYDIANAAEADSIE